MKIFLVIGFIVVFSGPWALAKSCLENQGALDFGSGTTKVYAARVDVCKRQIVEVLYEDRLPLALNEALERSASNEIPMAVVTDSLPQVRGLVSKMIDQQVVKIYAVATSVFRVAKNGRNIAQYLSKELGIPVEIISQNKEAELGYWSALSNKNLSPQDAVMVWDIGGGSMQMYTRQNQRVYIYEGDLASVTFKNKILEVLKFKDPKVVTSPNPIGEQREAAIQLAKNHAYLNVPKFFKKAAPKARWIGVGGVISMSVQRQTKEGADQFSQGELEAALKERSKLADSEIQSEYKISDVSNMALVLGYMKALGIEKIETAPVSLGQGLIYLNLQKR